MNSPAIIFPMLRRQFLWSTAGVSLARAASERLPRENLLLFHDSKGTVKPVRSIADWKKRREEIVSSMEQIMGPLPGKEKRSPLDMKIEEETDCGQYVRRLISYESEPGNRVPAYLLIPKRSGRLPAVLCLHPTDDKIGHKVVVGLGGRPNRQYAAELAERGFVSLAPAYPLLATYRPDWRKLGYRSGTMKAVWDNIRGLDLLESLPYVKRGSFGTIGHSLGGHNSVYTAVFDDRIRVIVSSCGLDSYVDYKNGDIRGWTSDRYMPVLLEYRDRLQEIPFDFHEMIGALAPRACFISAPLRDDNFKWKSVDAVVAAARPVYQLYGKPDNLIVKHPDCEHDFPDDMRQFAFDLIAREIGPAAR